MPKRFQQLTLRERIQMYPPWLILALSHVRVPRQTKEECTRRLWNRRVKEKRRRWKLAGRELPRRRVTRRLTLQEIVDRAGIPWFKHKTVRWIISHLTWDDLTVAQLLAFTEGCGFSLTKSSHIKNLKWRIHYQLEKQGLPFAHLTEPQRRELMKMLARWRKLNQLEAK